jgi:hypothetical protein
VGAMYKVYSRVSSPTNWWAAQKESRGNEVATMVGGGPLTKRRQAAATSWLRRAVTGL